MLWALDRDCFNNIVKDAARKKRDKFDAIMHKVTVLKELDPYEFNIIEDAIAECKFKKGEYVITQGDAADKLYILEEGTCKVTQKLGNGQIINSVTYNSGDYFGELGLIHDIPR